MGVLVGLAVGIPLAIIIHFVRRHRFTRNMPEGERRRQLISAIVDMRRQGLVYQDRLAYLRQQGLRKDVADVLLGEAERASSEAMRSPTP